MLSPITIRQDWENRHKTMKIKGIPFNKDEIKYLINVLYFFNSKFKIYEIEIRDEEILERVKSAYNEGLRAHTTATLLVRLNKDRLRGD